MGLSGKRPSGAIAFNSHLHKNILLFLAIKKLSQEEEEEEGIQKYFTWKKEMPNVAKSFKKKYDEAVIGWGILHPIHGKHVNHIIDKKAFPIFQTSFASDNIVKMHFPCQAK